MNISYKWLKEYVDFSLTPQQVADALTSEGLEVDSLEEVPAIRGGLKGIVVGEVLECDPHPDSDHMHVCSVNLGEKEPVQIVCGASNIAKGQKVMVATIGCVLYDGDKEFKIKKSRLRGIDSYGMICAEDEIGVGKDHNGIIVLPQDTKPGTPAAEYYNLESDYVIEIDITPNRADACSHYGVARDLYAWLVRNGYETSIHRPSVDDFKIDNEDLNIDIEVENSEACPRYCAITVKDCEVKESPEWLKTKLETIGLRSINNIVDITNYIMMAYGQPLHCFDADMIKGNKVVVRTMPEGTPFVTLDGVEHKLSEKDLAICNAEEPMCIAGVFGGKGSGTYDTTKDVLFESAYFNPTWIRKSARRHGLSTDASFRFERGIDPNGQIYALKQAAMLAKELAGGKISMSIKDVRKEEAKDFIVDLDYEYAFNLMGKVIDKNIIKEIVTSLEMKILEDSDNGLKLAVPPYRVDVTRPCDVVEDILRIYGYNNVEIPTSINSTLTIEGEEDRSHKLRDLVSEQLVGYGFNEVMNNSLTKTSYYETLENLSLNKAVKIMNPLSSDLGVMRQTLLFGGLENIKRNLNRKIEDLRFFEFGNCYHYDASKLSDNHMTAYSEELHLGMWLAGKREHNSWIKENEKTSIYELKAHVENVFRRLGVQAQALNISENAESDLMSVTLKYTAHNGKDIAVLGIVKHGILQKLDISGDVFFADINWTNLMKLTRKNKVVYSKLSKFPPVSRDLALLVKSDVKFADIERIARSTEKKLLKSVELFDVYEGKNIGEGMKSYAVNFILEDSEKTLTDERTDKVMKNIMNNLAREIGAQQR
ncbi:MAG: phenylalanine--tRNA ligase subunit beta [Bacteroidaceae bacterium]|nr:phenylalanine--tRNA ligase subunit beta [Bacteroidaceae bacterium]MDD7376006.1 phenylalanine--tRNA ligase subunit beta [Prevotellaceae bacterium]